MAQAKNVYLCYMYVRKKHNRSGTTSVVVVSKASGKYKEIKSFGSSSSEEDIESRCNKAAAWIRSLGGQQELDFDHRRGKEVEDTKRLLNNKIGMSVDHVLDIAKTITTIRIRMPENGTFFTKTLFLTDKHRTIMSLFDPSKDQF